MSLFIYVVAVVFPLFGTLKELIRYSLSKVYRAVVGKESLTLEKDKEDQSKYFLNYTMPPDLDLKWQNRDINVIEWANIPKFPLLLNGD